MEKKKLIQLFMILFLLMAMVAGIDRNVFQRDAEAESKGAEFSQIPKADENSLLRKDLEQAMAILEVCFNTPVTLERVRSVPITLTAYTSTVEECDDTPYFTASDKPVRPGIISVSADLVREMGLKFGQRVLIPGHGIFEVQDRMNPRLRRTVDIWMADRKVALLFGRQKGTLFWIASPEKTATQAQSTSAS
jgi:3D (Asp-Asp-Asp) domain-containing protein